MKPTVKAMLALACALALGCGDDSKIELPVEDDSSPVIGDDADASSRVASCDGAPKGTPCGAANRHEHCIFDACVENACGDGVPAYGEACDDGDELDGDGCSSRCKLEVAPGCGNGVLEPGEQCDDGNTTGGDDCERDCKLPASGGGTGGTSEGTGGTSEGTGGMSEGTGGMSAGTGGMSAGTGGTSGGTGGSDGDDEDAGTSDGGTAGNSECEACREANCHAYYSGSMDAVSGCFDSGSTGATARAAWTGEVFTPAQVQSCVDAIACAEMKHCGHDSGRPAAACYCGALYANNGDCAAATMGAPNGACKAEFEAATEETAPMNVMTAMSSADVPAGWAYFLLECETNFCAEVCSP
jgi:cysteine-rich repeat protein